MRPELAREIYLAQKAIGTSIAFRTNIQRIEYSKWLVRLRHHGKVVVVGEFATEASANKAYREAKAELKQQDAAALALKKRATLLAAADALFEKERAALLAKETAPVASGCRAVDALFKKERAALIAKKARQKKKTADKRLARRAAAKARRRELREQYEAMRKARRQEARELVAQYREGKRL